MFINGRWLKGRGDSLISANPATGNPVWVGQCASSDDVNSAVSTAKQAFYAWSRTSLAFRVNLLQEFRERLKSERNNLVESISRETGKPLWESAGEVQSMINKVNISIDAHTDRHAERGIELGAARSVTRYQPHGVVAVFGPFNLPGHLPNGHIVPALLAGNTVVFKPSEKTPMVAERVVQLWQQTGLPNGVLNLIQGGKDTGISLMSHPALDGLLFTGSYRTGKIIHEAFAGYPEKILALEMGGNNPLIVMEIDNLKAAAYLTIQSAYITSGQRCSCARRLIVPRGNPYDEFLDVLVSMTDKIRVGTYRDVPEPFMGPVIDEQSATHLLNAQANLVENNATSLIKMELAPNSKTILQPGLIDVTAVESRPDAETFGPLLQVIRVSDFEEAMTEANRTQYGLSAGILSKNKVLYEKFLMRARAGVINWNRPLTGASSLAPFGGVGRSGNHRASGYFAIDYCSYPVASLETKELALPNDITPGLEL